MFESPLPARVAKRVLSDLHSDFCALIDALSYMLIIPRYILRAHIAPFLFGTSVVMFLFLMQFILKYIDELIGKGLGTWVIMKLVALNLSWMVVLAVPMGVLFSTLMVFGSLSASHEITVLKASGAGLLRLMMPVIAAGIVATAAMFWFNDAILPDTNHKAKIMLWDIKKKKPTFDIEAGQFSMQLEGYTILSRSLDSARGLLLGVTIYDRTTPNRTNVVSADTGTIRFSQDDRNVVVFLQHGEIHQLFADQPAEFRHIRFSAHRIIIPAAGFTLQQSGEGVFARGDREMHISDMMTIVNEARRQQQVAGSALDTMLSAHVHYLYDNSATDAGYTMGTPPENDAIDRVNVLQSHTESLVQQMADGDKRERQYLVEVYKKYALPFACLVFVFVGCPLGIMTRGGNFGMSAAISLAFYVVYWAFLIGGEKLADRQIASPLAMWLANVVIGAVGILLTLRVHYGSLRIGALGSIAAKLRRRHA